MSAGPPSTGVRRHRWGVDRDRLVLGLLVYAGVLLAWHAGFTAAAPFVVIPPVGHHDRRGQSAERAQQPTGPAFNRPDPVPLPPLRGPAAPLRPPPRPGRRPDNTPAGGPGPGR